MPRSNHSIALNCQVRIELARRGYEPDEQARLKDLFGEPGRWGQTLRTMLWTHTSVNVRPFSGSTLADLPIPCTYDFNVATVKYFDGLEDGESCCRCCSAVRFITRTAVASFKWRRSLGKRRRDIDYRCWSGN